MALDGNAAKMSGTALTPQIPGRQGRSKGLPAAMTTTIGSSASRPHDVPGGFFEEIDHTADLALRCGGQDLDALFRSAALGMYRLMGIDAAGAPSGATHRVGLEAPDLESLLVDWLSELAFLAEVRKRVFPFIRFEILNATRLEALLSGGASGQLTTTIKAVTYHDLRIIETPEGYETTVVFDV